MTEQKNLHPQRYFGGRDRMWAEAFTLLGNRNYCEDAYGVSRNAGLAVVADGGGTPPFALAAAGAAADALLAKVRTTASGPGSDVLRSGFADASRQVAALVNSSDEAMGTFVTAAAAIVSDNTITVGWIGNCRCYLFRDGILQGLTWDQAWPHRCFIGDTPALVPVQEPDNYLGQRPEFPTPCRPLSDGSREPSVEIGEFEWRPTDMCLLCTDGLVDTLGHSALEGALQAGGSPAQLIARLFEAATSARPRDNTTVVLMGGPSRPVESPT